MNFMIYICVTNYLTTTHIHTKFDTHNNNHNKKHSQKLFGFCSERNSMSLLLQIFGVFSRIGSCYLVVSQFRRLFARATPPPEPRKMNNNNNNSQKSRFEYIIVQKCIGKQHKMSTREHYKRSKANQCKANPSKVSNTYIGIVHDS